MDKRKKRINYSVFSYNSSVDSINKIEWKNSEDKRKYMTNLAQEIGWIIIEFSSLENKLDSIIKFHLIEESKNKELLYSILTKKSYLEKIELFFQMLNINFNKYNNIYNNHFDNFIKELNELNNELKEVGQIRNNYAHSIFSNVDETKLIERKTELTNKGIEKIFIKYDFEDIDNDFEKIYSVGDKLSLFNEKILDCLTDNLLKH